MEKQKAIELLEQQQSAVDDLRKESTGSRKFKNWKRETLVVISNVFRRGHHGYSEFRGIHFEYLQKVLMTTPVGGFVDRYQEGLTEAYDLLQSLIKEVKDFWPDEPSTNRQTGNNVAPSGSDVFIAHGHDEGAKHKVARIIEHLGLKVIILDEQADRGLTVIEKFERHSKNVGFAVVLFTPDDQGKSVKEDDLKPRARQNVVFELGYFVARLGRKRVCLLRKGDVEIPSDYKGVLYTPGESDLKLKLAKEIKAAGIQIDADKIV